MISENRHKFARRTFIGLVTFSIVSVGAHKAQSLTQPPVLGRWDIVVKSPGGEYPSWLEIEVSGSRTLVGRFVGQFGSARPIANIKYENGEIEFSIPPQWERCTTDLKFTAKLVNDRLEGTSADEKGQKLTWTGRRAPMLKREGPVMWGQPITLLSQDSGMKAWKARFPERPNGWVARDGMLINEKPGNDLVTEQKFDDFKLHAEFKYPKGSNSGIYLRGRYEMQIEDNYGQPPFRHGIGAIYGYFVPSSNAAKPADEWQTVDVTLVGRHVTVELNGERVLDRQEIPGITGGALDSDEAAPGPLLIQGDHGPISFRNIVVTPAAKN